MHSADLRMCATLTERARNSHRYSALISALLCRRTNSSVCSLAFLTSVVLDTNGGAQEKQCCEHAFSALQSALGARKKNKKYAF